MVKSPVSRLPFLVAGDECAVTVCLFVRVTVNTINFPKYRVLLQNAFFEIKQ
jgi:hypothetical protein